MRIDKEEKLMSDLSFDRNIEYIERRLNDGIDLLSKHYKLEEIDTEGFDALTVAGNEYRIKQFDISGVGNLLVMSSRNEGPMQMSTFTLTPYYKNIPLFTTDYMYLDDRRMFLNEIYDLVEYKDDLYERYIQQFAENCLMVSQLQDMPVKECWYDSIRPVLAGKQAQSADDDLILELFIKNLVTFIEMEKETPLLSDEKKASKWKINFDYARKLVEDGGVSTDVFVKSIGAERTKNFFYSVFFAPNRYKPANA